MTARPINDAMCAQLLASPQKGRGFGAPLIAPNCRDTATFHRRGRPTHWTSTHQGRAALAEGGCHA